MDQPASDVSSFEFGLDAILEAFDRAHRGIDQPTTRMRHVGP
jgi:hypothetical protein